jgi:Fungal specific transcription factor domain
MRLKRHIDDRMSATMFKPQESAEIWGYWRAEKVQSGLSNLSAIISCFPPRPIADFLSDVFFKYAQTNYFLVDRGWSLEQINTIYTEPERLSTKHAPVISIVLSIFAIGTQYVYLDSTQRTHRLKGSTFSEDEVGKTFYQQAIKLLPEIIELSSLESVQAGLLFGVYTLPLDASGLGYVYLNLAIRLAMQNGMHRRYTGNALSAAMIETRNRVWWSAYTLDRYLPFCSIEKKVVANRTGKSTSSMAGRCLSRVATSRLICQCRRMTLLRILHTWARRSGLCIIWRSFCIIC